MPEKNILGIIRRILDSNNGFLLLSKLPASLSAEARRQLGIKSRESAEILKKKLEAVSEDSFMFHKKGTVTYIMTPCEPSELVFGMLSSKKAFDTKLISKLPFTKPEFISIVNELSEAGKAKIILDKNFKPQVFRHETPVIPAPEPETYGNTDGYTPEEFRRAFTELDRGRIAVRICDLRRRLGWPREVFDQMLRDLRDKRVIALRTGDASLMTADEVNDCFTDENGFRMGSVTWNVR